MRKNKRLWAGILSAAGLLWMILDTKAAVSGAADGVMLCIRSVIPSLFPFLFLSAIMNSVLLGADIPFMKSLLKLCAIPKGAGSLLLLGLLGGYPVGAQAIANAYKDGQLSKESAARMLGFCNNAGPAFIFGLIGTLFTSQGIPWVIWAIHILSALTVGVILPNRTAEQIQMYAGKPLTVSEALWRSVRTMANICGWVILFRVLIAACSRWFAWLLPEQIRFLLIGTMELTNGITLLQSTQLSGVRYVIATTILSAGGLCVAMQTCSVAEGVGLQMYFPGKILQAIISFFAAYITQSFLFDSSQIMELDGLAFLAILAALSITLMFVYRKKVVTNRHGLLYNSQKERRKGSSHAVSTEASAYLRPLHMGHPSR